MKKNKTPQQNTVSYKDPTPKFTAEMKRTYKILAPNMLPYHFDILSVILKQHGYDLEILHNETRAVIDEGLKHVHNDTCYPALCVTGQFLDALKSGKYDLSKTALLISQSGGGCRASNYIPLIRKALKSEFPQVPVLSLNFSGLEKDSGIEINVKMLLQLAYGIFYADAVMSLYNQCKPYEKTAGETDKTREGCIAYIKETLGGKGYKKYKKITRELLSRFAKIELVKTPKIRVGVVGEIYVKYSPLGNSQLEKFLAEEDCEAVIPALMDFVLYCVVNTVNDGKLYGKNKVSAFAYSLVYKFLLRIQRGIIALFEEYGFDPPHDFEYLRGCADRVIHQGVKMGEGWLIPAEMLALCESGVKNVVCAQPFGCLPNHIVGKGAARAVKSVCADVNIVPIDYDPSATKVNQENRLKLMLATARETQFTAPDPAPVLAEAALAKDE